MATTIRRVLLVDDEPDIRRIARMSLTAVGKWQVALAAGGEEALRAALEAVPDVILLDVMMPGMDGPMTLARLRAEPSLAAVPVIFMTASAHSDEVRRWLDLGAAGVIQKPFDPMGLPAEVRRLTGAA